MKNTQQTTNLIFSILCLWISINISAQTVTLYTPNGSTVEAFMNDEMSAQDITYYTNLYRNSYPQAEVLANASSTYNCHSYAWNLSEGGTTVCWLNQSPDLHKYWEDYSYLETTESNAEKIFYYTGDHSAVKSKTVAEKYESKWGSMPLMRHAPTYGPSLYNMTYRKYYIKFTDLCTISGPSQICDDGIYILDLPSGATVNWRSSDSFNFRVISGQGTTSATYEIRFPSMAGYVAQVIADITINGNVITVSKDVQLGTAMPPFTIFDTSSGAVITTNTVHTGIIYNFVVDDVPLTPIDNNYRWEVTPPENIPGVDPQFITLGSGQEMSYIGRIPGTYTVALKHYGECGWSVDNLRVLNMTGQIINLYFIVSPNPATEFLTISLVSSEDKKSGSVSSSSSGKVTSVEPYIIHLLNARHGLVRSAEASESTLQISLQDLPKGMYFVHMIRKDKVLQKQIIWIK